MLGNSTCFDTQGKKFWSSVDSYGISLNYTYWSEYTFRQLNPSFEGYISYIHWDLKVFEGSLYWQPSYTYQS